MGGLTHIEKQKLERELGMGSGYVLGFSNRTFEEFFREVVRIQINETAYDSGSGSKANRMRMFWQKATDDELRRCFGGLLEGWSVYSSSPMPDSARDLLRQVVKRLGGISEKAEPTQDEGVAFLDQKISAQLVLRLLQVTAVPPQKRGFEFEAFLKELFDAFGLSARASFRLIGEQIDGSFVVHNETYLLEAKWHNSPIGAADLHTFEGKLREKAVWSRGLFVSTSGFSGDGLEAFGRGKRVVCMDGFDLSEMLRLRRPFVEILDAKVRRAAETGNPFVSVRDLFLK